MVGKCRTYVVWTVAWGVVVGVVFLAAAGRKEMPLAAVAPEHSIGSTQQRWYTKALQENLFYFEDGRTGLCYAVSSMAWRDGSIGGMTLVDCEKVHPYLVRP
jgi:hypothetical protein